MLGQSLSGLRDFHGVSLAELYHLHFIRRLASRFGGHVMSFVMKRIIELGAIDQLDQRFLFRS